MERLLAQLVSAIANTSAQVKTAVTHTVGQIGSSLANAFGLGVKSNYDMKARKVEADSTKKQKFLDMAGRDSTEYYRTKASVINSRINYKNSQKQRKHEAKMHKLYKTSNVPIKRH